MTKMLGCVKVLTRPQHPIFIGIVNSGPGLREEDAQMFNSFQRSYMSKEDMARLVLLLQASAYS